MLRFLSTRSASAVAGALLVCSPALHAEDPTAWLFSSFRDSGDGLHLAYSEDGLDWTDLDRVFLEPSVGSKLMRDPHLLRADDGLYHMVWTSGWNDLGIGYATSTNLVDWSEQTFIPLMQNVPGTTTCWAPELFFDDTSGNYIIVWSSAVTDPQSQVVTHRAYYTLTQDFKTFTDPKCFFDPGFNNIDTTIHKVGDQYVIYFKETDDQPKKIWGSIYAATAKHPLGPYELLPNPPLSKQRAEGPAPVTVGDKTYLYFDYYTEHRYGVLETTDHVTWTDVSKAPGVAVVKEQRHGSIIAVPPTLVETLRLRSAEGVPKPILEGFTADPSIRAFGDTYYIYPTSDRPFWNTTEFAVWSSKNLVEWTKEPILLDLSKEIEWADIKAWAPDCIERDGTYYFYFCGLGKIGVATSTSPIGPFKDALGKPLLDINKDSRITTNTIDPYPFIDDDGQAYMYWGNGDVAQAFKLNPDMISIEGDPITIELKDFREGIVIFKRAGKYYFMWSIDDARSPNYRVGWGTADSPLGPVTTPEKDFLVLQKNGAAVGTAHHSIVNVPGTDRWYVAYHRHAVPGGGGYKRETCLVEMKFDQNGAILPMDPLSVPFQPGDIGEPIEAHSHH